MFPENDKVLIQEIIRHASFARECVQKFHGRVNLLIKVGAISTKKVY